MALPEADSWHLAWPRALVSLAEIQRLALAPDLEAVYQRLAPSLAKYAELEFRSDGRCIALITSTTDPAQVQGFERCLMQRGTTAPVLQRLHRVAQFRSGRVIGFKIPVAGPLAGGGEVYTRGALAFDELPTLVGPIYPDSWARLLTIAEALGKRHVYGVGMDLTEHPTYTLLLTQYQRTTPIPPSILVNLCAVLGFEQAIMQDALTVHEWLATAFPSTLFVSCLLEASTLLPCIKLDYEAVDTRMVAGVLTFLGLDQAHEQFARWTQQQALERARYAGVVITPSGLPHVRAYFS